MSLVEQGGSREQSEVYTGPSQEGLEALGKKLVELGLAVKRGANEDGTGGIYRILTTAELGLPEKPARIWSAEEISEFHARWEIEEAKMRPEPRW